MTTDTPTEPDLDLYSTVIVAFSGGKDSFGCLLELLKRGVPRSKIELWHHEVDGQEGSHLMDWSCTPDYCRAVGTAFGIQVYFSWKVGGFEREMARKDSPTAPTSFETPGGHIETIGGHGKSGTRGVFPQVSPDLSVRWCSAYLKIDVCAAAIRNQERFNHARTLVVTGERAEESTSRAKYKTFEPHRSDNRESRSRRHVDQWRPVHGHTEQMIWDLLREFRVNPHPAYRLGWGRVSCAACIFGSPGQWASLRAVNPAQFYRVAELESASGKTIQRKLSVVQLAARGTPYAMDPADVRTALSRTFDEPIILPEGTWTLPRGAFGDSCGPT